MEKNVFLLLALVAKATHVSNSCSNETETTFCKMKQLQQRRTKTCNLWNSTVGKILLEEVGFFKLEALLQIQKTTDLKQYFD